MPKLVNRAKMTTATTGTGTITLGTAVPGFQSFGDAGVANGNVVRYTIEDGANWEVGSGTYTASGTTLSRTPSESSSGGAAINLSGGAVVYATVAAADLQELVNFAETFTLPTADGTNGQVLTTNGTGTLSFTTVSGGGSSPDIGQVVFTETAPTTGTWLEAGKYYSKATYPALAAALGNVPDIGTPTTPQTNIPVDYVLASTTGYGYAAATNGTTTVVVGNSGAIFYTLDGVDWKPTPSFTSTSLMNVQYLNGMFIATGTGSSGLLTYSSDGINWTVNNSFPTATFPSVAYGAGVYVIGSGGMRYSSDLKTWQLTNDTSFSPRRIVYANGIFVAVGAGCRTSPDGVTWSSRSIPGGTYDDLIYANGLFVALSTSRFATSPDGISWTDRGSPNNFQGRQLIYANGLFVAVGNNGTAGIATSADGITWTDRTPAGYVLGYRSVCWTGSTFVAVGSFGRYATSPDGITWTTAADPSLADFGYVAAVGSKAVAFSQSQSVIVAGHARTVVLQGTLGAYSLSQSGANNQPTVAFNGVDQYVMPYGTGTILVSSDAQTWTLVDTGDRNTYDKVFYLNGNYLAFGAVGAAVTSSNGTSWSAVTAPSYSWNAAAYGAGVYVVVGSNGSSSGGITSGAGTTWTQRVTETIPFFDVIYANGLFVAVGGTGNGSSGSTVAYRSADGITWTLISGAGLPASVGWNRIIYQNSLFVLVGNGGRIATSVDGITWTARTSNVTGDLFDVIWSGSLFCAVGVNVVTTSPDGVTWTSRAAAGIGNIRVVYHDGTKFCAYGRDNFAVFKSSDGITWNRGSTAISESTTVYGARFLGGKHIFTGSQVIQTSTDAENWTPDQSVSFSASSTMAVYNLGGFYYALTNRGLYVSSDGISFSVVKTAGRRQHRAMAYSGSVWVLVAVPGNGLPQTFYRSTNGTTWTKSAEVYATAAVSATPSTQNGNDLIFCGSKFFSAQTPSSTAPIINQGLLTSTDGITWTPEAAGFPGASVSTLATDGSRILASTNSGALVSDNFGASWTLLVSGGVFANYSNGVWVFANRITADFSTIYSGVNQFNSGMYVVSENLIYGLDSSGNPIRYTLGSLPITLSLSTAVYSAFNTSSHKGFVPRGNVLLVPSSVSYSTNPSALVEFPLYSYNTTTTFWVPDIQDTYAQKAYVYAGA